MKSEGEITGWRGGPESREKVPEPEGHGFKPRVWNAEGRLWLRYNKKGGKKIKK